MAHHINRVAEIARLRKKDPTLSAGLRAIQELDVEDSLPSVTGEELLDEEEKLEFQSLGDATNGKEPEPTEYYRYATSEDFNDDPCLESVAKLLECYVHSESPKLIKVWGTFHNEVLEYIQERAYGILGVIKRAALDHTLLNVVLEALSEGRTYERGRKHRDLITDLSDLLDTQNRNVKVIITEAKIHSEQVLQFSQQVNHASEALSSAVHGVEKLQASLLEKQTVREAPIPSTSHRPPVILQAKVQPASTLTTDAGSSTEQESIPKPKPIGHPAAKVDLDGSYSGDGFDFRLKAGVLSSINVIDPAFNALTSLRKQPKAVAAYFLNKNLRQLKKVLSLSPVWMMNFVADPSVENRGAALTAIKHLDSATYQYLYTP